MVSHLVEQGVYLANGQSSDLLALAKHIQTEALQAVAQHLVHLFTKLELAPKR